MVREAQAADLDRLAVLFDQYRQFYGKSSDETGSRTFLEERVNKQDSVIYVFENEEGKLTGFTQLYPIFSSTRMKRMWLLNDLFVSKEYRGLGMSKALIKKAQENARSTGACSIMLETGKENHIGNKLYPSMGFEAMDTVTFFEWDAL
ncbi:MAG: GNAT family N-acetyltransferase [Bacteroidota bacterium]